MEKRKRDRGEQWDDANVVQAMKTMYQGLSESTEPNRLLLATRDSH